MPNFPDDIVREMNDGKKAIESTYQDDGNLQNQRNKKNAYTTIKVSREYKELFDVLAHKAFSKRIEFIEEIIESWEKNNGEQEILEMCFAKGQLSTRRR
jgi:hypothetical protein